MKKIWAFLALMLVLIWPVAAFAANEIADTELAPGTGFSVDNINLYDGMENTYKDGYMPSVKDGTVIVVLPLIANGNIKGNIIAAALDLGDTATSPFVYKNYQKTISMQYNATSEGITVATYLVRFDLPLASGRVNGVYPVTIQIQAQGTDGSPIQQAFTSYVTIADGKDPNEQAASGSTPSSQPKVIVSGYSISASPVVAGDEVTATITLKNTSETKAVQNMTVTASCDSLDLSLENESNTFYINKLARGKTTDIVLKYKTDLETPAQQFNIALAMNYDNAEGTPLTATGVVPITVSQPLRVKLEAPQLVAQVNAGDTMPLSFQVMNMGRGKVYNVRCELFAPGLIPSGTAFIGNMEAGTAASGNMDVFIGTKDMTQGYEGKDKYGLTRGKITLIYEDEAGKAYTEDTEFSTTINEPVINTSDNTPEEEPVKAGQWWISILIGCVIIAGLSVVLVVRGKKRKQHEDI